jgi:hypothetical protein
MTALHKMSESVTLCEVVVIDFLCIIDYNIFLDIAELEAMNNQNLRTQEEGRCTTQSLSI